MAQITSYAALKTAVQSWLNRSDNDTVAAIPTFISFAETDFQRTLKLPYYENNITSTVAKGTTGIPLPDDYYELKHLFVNDMAYDRVDVMMFKKYIHQSTTDSLTERAKNVIDDGSAKKNLRLVTRVGNTLKVYPDLEENDKVDLIYYQEIPPMVSDTDNPQSLVQAPDILLYLALRHAAVFLRDNDQAQFWTQKAEEAGTRLMQQLDEIEWSGSPITVREMNY